VAVPPVVSKAPSNCDKWSHPSSAGQPIIWLSRQSLHMQLQLRNQALASESLPASTGPLGISPKEGGSHVYNRINCEPASSQENPALQRRNAPLSKARRADDWPTLVSSERPWPLRRWVSPVVVQVGFENTLLIALSLTFGVFAIAGAWVVAFAMEVEVTTESRLLRDALTDALTGLDNRRGLNAALDSEWNRARRSGRASSMLFIDIDHFKRFNDALGHEVGDGVLIWSRKAYAHRWVVRRTSLPVTAAKSLQFFCLTRLPRARMHLGKLYVNGCRPCIWSTTAATSTA
jgi:hypothetical protein